MAEIFWEHGICWREEMLAGMKATNSRRHHNEGAAGNEEEMALSTHRMSLLIEVLRRTYISLGGKPGRCSISDVRSCVACSPITGVAYSAAARRLQRLAYRAQCSWRAGLKSTAQAPGRIGIDALGDWRQARVSNSLGARRKLVEVMTNHRPSS